MFQMSASGPSKKHLIALDFDHSVIEDNSDVYVQQLSPGGKIPAEIEQLYRTDGWTDYMAAIFKHLHSSGVKVNDIHELMQSMLLVDGMSDLFHFCKDNNYDIIIISDSNSLFIDLILRQYELSGLVDKVFTNPASFDDQGCLTIQFYHRQDWCQLSSINLCKGHILEEYIASRANEGVTYDQVSFVGDGSNDLCPMLRLRSQDLAFVRKNFRLEKIISRRTEQDLKAKVIMWDNGKDILDVLKSATV